MITAQEVLSTLGIRYEDKGTDFVIRCPNPQHNDRNPSCYLHKTKGVFICFSCGYTGNLNTLVKLHTGKTIWDYYNIKKTDMLSFEYQKGKAKKKEIIRGARKSPIFIDGETRPLTENIQAYKYFLSIGGSKKFAETFGVGWVEYVKINHTIFQDRLIFPVYWEGALRNVEGRDFTKKQDKKVIYPKGSTTNIFYNWDRLEPKKPVVMVEGIKDLIKVWHVYPNVISTFGSALSKKQLSILKETGLNLILFIDNDKAGWKEAESLDANLEKEFRICLPDKEGQDPNDLSLETIKEKIKNAVPYGDYLYEQEFPNKKLNWR